MLLAAVFLAVIGMVSAANNSSMSYNESIDFTENGFTGNVSVGHGTQPITALELERKAVKTVNGSKQNLGPAQFNLSLSGNVSRIGKVYNQVVGAEETVAFNVYGDGIGSSQPYGWYNGSVSAVKTGDSSVNASIPVNVLVVDGVSPNFEGIDVSGMMATNSQVVSVDVVDNIETVNVSGAFIYEEVVNKSTGERRNVTVQNVVFQERNDGSWTTKFNESSEIGGYYLTVSAVDGSGNKASQVRGFRVNGLDSIRVLETDFDFKDMRPRTDANPERRVERRIFEKELDKPLKIRLENGFSHRRVNSSMTVGIRHEDSENIQKLYTEGENKGVLNVTSPGVYYLVVYSDSKGDTYDGELEFEAVPQHVEIPDVIRFTGTVVDPEYPEIPDEKELGSFTGSLEFLLNENDVPTGIRFIGEQRDLTGCRGADSWSNCIPGFSLGEIDEVKQENQDLEKRNNSLVLQRNAAAVILAVFITGFILKTRREGDIIAYNKVPKQKIGSYRTEYLEEQEA